MSEKAFYNNDQMNLNPYQDPMGKDAHTGLERFLDKFHQPGVPSHTIITDPDYYVFLWFHNAIGNLIECPYTKGGYTPLMRKNKKDFSFDSINKAFSDGIGINGSGDEPKLPDKCLDLTPFVREATLPSIAPANGTKIKTLFGNTTAGTFSPYVSDGSKSITLSMIDTEYCILDAIFYPWMQDINSPWWYRPDKVYDEWATPYPMATLEVQRPRMRYKSDPKAGDSRNIDGYTYYSYRFVGVKPTEYTAFPVAGGGTSNLLRTLTLVADMCIVDVLGDAHLSTNGSANFGNRTGFIFQNSPTQESSSDTPDESKSQENPTEEMKKDLKKGEEDLEQAKKDSDDNKEDIDQQQKDDMPGEDEPEDPGDEDPGYGDEYPNEFSSHPDEPLDETPEPEPDADPNGDSDDQEQGEEYEKERTLRFVILNKQNREYDEESFWDKVCDTSKSVGGAIADGLSTAGKWAADSLGDAIGMATTAADIVGKAVSAGSNVLDTVVGAATDAVTGAMKTESGIVNTAGNAFAAVSNGLNKVMSGKPPVAFGVQTPGTVGSPTVSKDRLDTTQTVGAVDGSLSSSFAQLGDKVQGLANEIGGIMGNVALSSANTLGNMCNQLNECNQKFVSPALNNLNSAAYGLVNNLDKVGMLASDVKRIQNDPYGSSVGKLGKMVNLMTNSTGVKPTPIESYAEMVTKQNAKGSTAI